ISSHTREAFDLPSCIFTCSSLTVSKASIYFNYISEEGWNQIFRNSPMLEDVIMEDCDVENFRPLHIYSSSLRSLNIDVRVYSPRLMSLKITGYVEKSIFIENMTSLVDATIDLKFFSNIRAEVYSSHLIKFLKDISHMKF
ncbi:hypothetical protein MKW94_002028, partial [Papaver nudicaule]|nr:hypothetical protein [Papaver nudicaule]